MLKEYIAYLKDNPKHYWFKAKVFGWGWVPVTWQGWLVIAAFVIALIGNTLRLAPSQDSHEMPLEFIIETIILVLLLVFICWKKGEPPRWQWGIPKK